MARTLKTPSVLDLRFQSFGQYLVLGKGKKTKHGQFWVCQCACNMQAEIHEAALVDGRATSCGCDYQGRGTKLKDLTGFQIGKWLVLGLSNRLGRQRYWHCVCLCGKIKEVLGCTLRDGDSRGCALCIKPLTKHRWYGDLFTLRITGTNKHRQAVWLCVCKCGREHTVSATEMRDGGTRSCGCFKRKKRTERAQNEFVGKFGDLPFVGCASGPPTVP